MANSSRNAGNTKPKRKPQADGESSTETEGGGHGKRYEHSPLSNRGISLRLLGAQSTEHRAQSTGARGLGKAVSQGNDHRSANFKLQNHQQFT